MKINQTFIPQSNKLQVCNKIIEVVSLLKVYSTVEITIEYSEDKEPYIFIKGELENPMLIYTLGLLCAAVQTSETV